MTAVMFAETLGYFQNSTRPTAKSRSDTYTNFIVNIAVYFVSILYLFNDAFSSSRFVPLSDV
jgi:hypothetical protein